MALVGCHDLNWFLVIYKDTLRRCPMRGRIPPKYILVEIMAIKKPVAYQRVFLFRRGPDDLSAPVHAL
jgi:hypothetical protein